MVNKTTKNVGDFQAGVGKVGADMGMIISVIFAVILVIIAIVLTVLALIPVTPGDCPEAVKFAQQNKDSECSSYFQLPSDCEQSKKALAEAKKHCATKEKRLVLLFGLLLIPFAALIVGLSHWWRGEVHGNRTAAQVGGTMLEVGVLQDIFGH
jgi:uncharacterized Tic20 family protein